MHRVQRSGGIIGTPKKGGGERRTVVELADWGRHTQVQRRVEVRLMVMVVEVRVVLARLEVRRVQVGWCSRTARGDCAIILPGRGG